MDHHRLHPYPTLYKKLHYMLTSQNRVTGDSCDWAYSISMYLIFSIHIIPSEKITDDTTVSTYTHTHTYCFALLVLFLSLSHTHNNIYRFLTRINTLTLKSSHTHALHWRPRTMVTVEGWWSHQPGFLHNGLSWHQQLV